MAIRDKNGGILFVFFPICINFAPPKRQKMKITKNRYLAIFIIIVLVLAVVRCVNPGIAGDRRLADGADSLENRLDADSLQVLAGNGAAEKEMAAICNSIPAKPSATLIAAAS